MSKNKKAFKRLFSALLAVLLVLSAAPLSVFAGLELPKIRLPFLSLIANAASEGDLTFTLSGDGNSYSVTACNSDAAGALTIPGTYNGKPVTSIGYEAFSGCTGLTEVTIPDSVTEIDEYAFYSCPDAVIYGYTGSCAESYASENSLPFKPLGTSVTSDVLAVSKEYVSVEGRCLTASSFTDALTGSGTFLRFLEVF